MAQLNRRSFLKFLSVSPAIFHASYGFTKIPNDFPKEFLSDSEILQSITEETPILPGTLQYNIQEDTMEIYDGKRWKRITSESLQT